jgi:hypothetical protein
MHAALEKRFISEIAEAQRLLKSGSLDEAFVHLERAHVLGQRYIVPHIQTHWLMLRIGLSRRSVAEVSGQAARIVLGALGSAINVVPTGNTGGTNISMFKRLPIDPELEKVLDEQQTPNIQVEASGRTKY